MAEQPAEPSERRERRDSRENRQRLLEAAKLLFAEHGARDTSMQKIAQAAGVGQGTLYRHFTDKADLCRALIHDDIERFKERVGALLHDRTTSPLARLNLALLEKLYVTESHLSLFTIIHATSAPPRDRPFRGLFSSWLYVEIVALLEEAQALGEIRPIDIPFAADAMLTSTSPGLYGFMRQELGYSIERIAAGLRELYVDGLRV